MDILKQPIPISIILCSRQRVESLRALLDSLAENCKNPISYEVLIAGDKDDLDTFKFYEWKLGQTEKYLNVRFRFSEQVRNLHVRINTLVRISRGNLLWILNDDCLVETKNWDQTIIDTFDKYLKDKPDKVAYGHISCNSVDKIGEYSSFPTLTKEAVNALGYFMHPEIRYWAADCSLWAIFKPLNRVVHIPDIVVNHFLHGKEAGLYQNPLRTEILEWHKVNNIHPLQDFYNIDHAKEIEKVKKYLQ
jgi:hypothetical protein